MKTAGSLSFGNNSNQSSLVLIFFQKTGTNCELIKKLEPGACV
jgi:hypothetical protein